MKTLWVCTLLVILWLMAAPLPGFAQTGSGLAGTARDTSGAVLPGVTVEASSPALIEKVRVVVTDSAGQFGITALPPGRYTVTFSLPGFTTVKREGIDLVTGFTGNVNADMPVGNLAESITVTGASPVVDVQNTRQQVAVTRDLIDAVPTGKMFQQLAAMIPAVVTEGNDVGGLNGQRVTGVTLHGSRETDTEQQIDGSPVMSWGSIATTTTMLSDGAYQEFVIDVSGASAETETGGVRVNYIPREGGNTFSGGLVANGSHPSLQGKNITPALRAQGLRDPQTLKRLWTVNPNVGGPLMRDRVWFFANYAKIVSDLYAAGSYLNSCLDCWEYKPDLTRQALDDELGRDGTLRLTWQATPRHKVTAFLEDNYHCKCRYGQGGIGAGGGAASATNRSESVLRAVSWGQIYQVGWTFPATRRLLVQGGFSRAPLKQARVNQPEVIAPRIEDAGIGVNYRAGNSPSLAYMVVDTYRGAVSYVTGSHSVKVGATAVMGPTRREVADYGALRYRALNGVPTSVTYLRTPFTTRFEVTPNLGVYAQDQWTVKNLTLNGGLRFDFHRNIQPAQTLPPSGYVREAVSAPFQVGVAWKDLEPRLGVSYDVFGNGKTALKGTLNRYGLRLSYNQASTLSPFGNNTNTRRWTDTNGDRIVQGDPFNHATNGELGPSQNLAFGQPVSTVHFDPDYQTGWGVRPMNWEVSAGVQQELTSGVALNATLTRRIYGNFPLFENQAAPASAWDEYCVTAPVDARLPNGGGYELCGIYDLQPAFVGRQDYLGTRTNEGYGTQQEQFTAIDVSVNARLQGLLLQGGVSSGKLMTDNCAIVASAPSSVGISAGNTGLSRGDPNPNSTFCHTESPFLTQFKVSGAYTLPWQEIQVSGVYQDLPGPEILASAAFTRAQAAPSLGRALSQGSTATIPLVSPGTLYAERMHQVDLRVAKTVRVGRTRIQGQLDLYNALNASSIRVYSGEYGATTGPDTGAAFLIPAAILTARVIKVGMQLTF